MPAWKKKPPPYSKANCDRKCQIAPLKPELPTVTNRPAVYP